MTNRNTQKNSQFREVSFVPPAFLSVGFALLRHGMFFAT